MKDITEYIKINEARKSDTCANPFKSREELDAFIDEVEKTKLIINKYEKEAQEYWSKMQKLQDMAEKEFKKNGYNKLQGQEWDDKYDEIQKKYKIDEIMHKAEEVTKAPECIEANQKLYKELQQRALDSLTPKEQKAIGKRGGRLYNIMNEVLKKYMRWDFIKNQPVQ